MKYSNSWKKGLKGLVTVVGRTMATQAVTAIQAPTLPTETTMTTTPIATTTLTTSAMDLTHTRHRRGWNPSLLAMIPPYFGWVSRARQAVIPVRTAAVGVVLLWFLYRL